MESGPSDQGRSPADQGRSSAAFARHVKRTPSPYVKVAGLVLMRQRPSTASGIVFMTLEDETGIVNLIIRPKIFDQYLAAARHGKVLLVEGRVERNGKVIHVMARRFTDIGPDLDKAIKGSPSSMQSHATTMPRSRDFH